MAAAFLQVEELALEKEEANTLAKAIADVADLYPVEFSDKQAKWMALAFAVATVEGPRAWFLFKKAQENRARNAKPSQARPPATRPQGKGTVQNGPVPPASVAPPPGFPPFVSGQG